MSMISNWTINLFHIHALLQRHMSARCTHIEIYMYLLE